VILKDLLPTSRMHAGSYASARWLTKLLNAIGYEITALHKDETGDAFNTHVSWAEIKKPGELKQSRPHRLWPK
jgi:hypothetical protein